ncbi:MAG: hypothetical protein WCS16_06575, partial [Desulfuromonas sp.]
MSNKHSAPAPLKQAATNGAKLQQCAMVKLAWHTPLRANSYVNHTQGELHMKAKMSILLVSVVALLMYANPVQASSDTDKRINTAAKESYVFKT